MLGLMKRVARATVACEDVEACWGHTFAASLKRTSRKIVEDGDRGPPVRDQHDGGIFIILPSPPVRMRVWQGTVSVSA